jgi:hypothetical protein
MAIFFLVMACHGSNITDVSESVNDLICQARNRLTVSHPKISPFCFIFTCGINTIRFLAMFSAT